MSGTTTGSSISTWRKPDHKMPSLSKMFIVSGFRFLSLTILKRTRRPRCFVYPHSMVLLFHILEKLFLWNGAAWSWSQIIFNLGDRGHRADPDQGGRLHWERGWQRRGDQHLRGGVQQDHLRAGLHQDFQVHLPAAALPLWHTGGIAEFLLWGRVV